jgi:CDGSH-type Zn-finger protein
MTEKYGITADDMARCWCGRSPTGKCDGSHTFTDDQWAEINYEFKKDTTGSAQDSWFNKTDDYWNKDLK